jgi:hypothetical protein
VRVLVVLMLLTLVLSSFCSLTFDSFTFWWSQLVALSFAFGGLVHCNWWPCPLQLVASMVAIGGLVHCIGRPCPPLAILQSSTHDWVKTYHMLCFLLRVRGLGLGLGLGFDPFLRTPPKVPHPGLHATHTF